MAPRKRISKKAATKGKKPRGKPFPKGQSGNPAGRPALTFEERQSREALVKRARDMSPAVLDNLAQLAEGKGLPAIRAGEIILDRAWGRPKQDAHVEVELSKGGVMVMLPPADPEP